MAQTQGKIEDRYYSIAADLPYFVKHSDQKIENRKRFQQIREYYLIKNKNYNQETVIHQIKNDYYFQFSLPNVVPLSQIMEQLLQTANLTEQQLIFVNYLIDTIIEECDELYSKRQLFHNNINFENILVISNKNQFYANSKLYVFKVKFINFQEDTQQNMQFSQETYNNDITQLKIIFQMLLVLSKSKIHQTNCNSFRTHLDFQQINSYFQVNQQPSLTPIILFPDIYTKEQVEIVRRKLQVKEKACQEINSKFNQPTNKNVELAIKTLRSIVLQIIYQSSFNQFTCETIFAQYSSLTKKIEDCQQEIDIFVMQQIENFQNLINQNFKLDFKVEVEVYMKDNIVIFGENLFQKLYEHSNFNFQLQSLGLLEQLIAEQCEQSKSMLNKQIGKAFEELFAVAILEMILGLI